MRKRADMSTRVRHHGFKTSRHVAWPRRTCKGLPSYANGPFQTGRSPNAEWRRIDDGTNVSRARFPLVWI